MRQLRTLAVAATSAVLIMGQAVAAFGLRAAPGRSLGDRPRSLSHSQVLQPHGR